MFAGVLYIAVTVLFYSTFKPLSRAISLVAAIISLAGIAIGPLSFALKPLAAISPLMAFAGLGWLTFLSPSFALSLSPFIFLPGIIGEGALTLWLVVFGVDEERWKEQLAGKQ